MKMKWFYKHRVFPFGFCFAFFIVLFTSIITSTANPAPATIRIGVFSSSLPFLVAEQEGFFAAQGLTVNSLPVTSSTQQFGSLRDGQYDMISTSPDNVVNYRLNSSNALGSTLPVQFIANTQYGGNLSVVGRPGTTSLTDFRGSNMAVDSPSSGFAYVLYRILENAGLVKDIDYSVVPCGGTTQRFQALINGQCLVNGTVTTVDGGALLSGLTLFAAESQGFPILQTIQETTELNPYMGTVIAASDSWLSENKDVAVRFVAALYAATEWALAPANRERAIEILDEVPNVDRTAAELQYTIDTTPSIGLNPGIDIDRDAFRNIVELRNDFGGFDEPQNLNYLVSPASKLYDTSYVKEAERLLKQQGR